MARIRSIKPEFFTSADIVKMSPLSRLFYASLWCESDREGRLKWDVQTLKLRYFPADDCDINALAAELVSGGLIIIYTVEGKQYAEIPSFKSHQVINNREAESLIPSRVKEASPRVSGEGKGKEGKGKEGNARDAFDAASMEVDDLINKTSWVEWARFRQKRKKSITEDAARKQLEMLARYEQSAQARIIDKSIQNDWQGLFEPDDKSGALGQSEPRRRLQKL